MHQHFAAIMAIAGMIYWPVADAPAIVQAPIPIAELPDVPLFAMTQPCIPRVWEPPSESPTPPVPKAEPVAEIPAQPEAVQPVYYAPAVDQWGYGYILNQQRASRGLPGLYYDPSIDYWCQQNNYAQLEHARKRLFYKGHHIMGPGYVNQNAGLGQTSVAQMADDWWESLGHRAGILNPRSTRYGISMDGNAWTCEFH